MSSSPVTAETVQRLFRGLEDHTVVEVLSLNPTDSELEQVTMWLASEDDVMAKLRKPLTGRCADIYAVIRSDLAPPDDEARG